MKNLSSHQQLLEYTSSSLHALLKLAEFFEQKENLNYRDPIGGHLRHLIEHYETLIYSNTYTVNYDSRQRDEVLERDPSEAIRRLNKLLQKIQTWNSLDATHPISVSSLGGQLGEVLFTNTSSIGRELCFLNSHTVHHLALLKPICQKFGIEVDEYFGFAPSTIAYLESQKLEI